MRAASDGALEAGTIAPLGRRIPLRAFMRPCGVHHDIGSETSACALEEGAAIRSATCAASQTKVQPPPPETQIANETWRGTVPKFDGPAIFIY